jgi:hypothetical protein
VMPLHEDVLFRLLCGEAFTGVHLTEVPDAILCIAINIRREPKIATQDFSTGLFLRACAKG